MPSFEIHGEFEGMEKEEEEAWNFTWHIYGFWTHLAAEAAHLQSTIFNKLDHLHSPCRHSHELSAAFLSS